MTHQHKPPAKMSSAPRPPVVIAGAGIVGLSTAYYLAEKHGMSSIVVDMTGTVAPGASGKAAGFLARDWNNGTPTEALTHRSFQLHQELADKFGDDSIQYRRLKCISIDSSTGKREDEVEWVAETDSIKEVLSMGKEDSVAQVHPKLLCEKLWEAAENAGCQLVKGKVIGAVHNDKGRLQGARLDDGSIIEASALLYACGPWVANIMNGIKGHSVVVPTERVLTQCVFFYEKGDNVCEVFVRPDSTAFCTGIPATGDPIKVTEYPGQESVEPEKISRLLDRVQKFTGHGPGSTVLGAPIVQQACYQPVTDDYLPIIGPLSRRAAGGDQCFMAGGLNCWGILCGPATGECMADLIATGKTPNVNLSKFRPSRYRNLKPVSG